MTFYKHQDKPCFFNGQGNPDQVKYKEGTNRRLYTREEREDAAKAAFGEGNYSKALSEFVRAAELCIIRPSGAAREQADGDDLVDADGDTDRAQLSPVTFAVGTHTLFGNIAAVLTKIGRFGEAVEAAEHAVSLDAEWAKGYFRKGAALYALGRFHEAVEAYDAGLLIEPNNGDLKQGRELAVNEAKSAKPAREGGGGGTLKDARPKEAAGASGDVSAETTGNLGEKDEELTETARYAVKLEEFLERTVPSQTKAALKRKREEDERAEQLLADASELSKTMAFGLKKNPQGDRWEDFFCEQRVR